MSEKPPILFLHGAFSGPEVWTQFVAPWFAARGHRVLAPRLFDPFATRPARLRDYVRRAVEAADTLDKAPVVIAHSLGGLVAQHLATRRRVAGMALVASPGPAGLGPSFWQLSAGAPDVLASLLAIQSGVGPLLPVEAVRRALFTEETPDEWIRGVMQPLLQESPLVLLDGLAWDFPPWYLVRRAPMLALIGNRDAFVPVTDLWATAMAYGAETEVMAGFGHGMPIDPRWKALAWRINAWMDERQLLGVARRQHSAVADSGISR